MSPLRARNNATNETAKEKRERAIARREARKARAARRATQKHDMLHKHNDNDVDENSPFAWDDHVEDV